MSEQLHAEIIEGRTKGGCPVVHLDINKVMPVDTYHREFDHLRSIAPIVWNTFGDGFWMLMEESLVREAYNTPEIFTSDSTFVTMPNPDFHFIPTMEKAPRHKLYRRVLNPQFSPRSVRDREDRLRDHATELLDRIAPLGRVNYVDTFAKVFPTKVFLEILCLPPEDSDHFVGWVEDIFAGLGSADEALVAGMVAAQGHIFGYFTELLADRKANPREDDFFTDLTRAKIGDEPISDEEFLNICIVLVLAGLDTVKSQLGYTMLHLARYPEDRQRLLDDPDVIPIAVDELTRIYSIVMDGRKIGQDAEFHGCPVRQGDMAMLAVPSATRDAKKYGNPTRIDFDRPDPAGHLAFAAGPHKCLGLHLARREMTIALEEWLARIPHFRVVNPEALVETGGQLGLEFLELEWDVPSDGAGT